MNGSRLINFSVSFCLTSFSGLMDYGRNQRIGEPYGWKYTINVANRG